MLLTKVTPLGRREKFFIANKMKLPTSTEKVANYNEAEVHTCGVATVEAGNVSEGADTRVQGSSQKKFETWWWFIESKLLLHLSPHQIMLRS